MAIQFYNITSTGKKYALDKTNGKATEISSIPTGGATITWNNSSLPDELKNSGITTQQSIISQPSQAYNPTYNPPPAISDAQYQTIRQMVSAGQLTPKDAVNTLNQQIQQGQYSGSVDVNRLFPQGFSYQGQDGATYKVGSDLSPIRTTTAIQNTVVTPQGIKTFTTPSGAVVDEQGNLISQTTNQTIPDQPHPNDTSLADLLKNSNLTQDQKNMVKGMYDIVSKYDEAQAKKLVAAFNVATQFSDPFFKAQTAMVVNSLNRGLAANAGDLKFSETQLQNTLADLKSNIEASKDYADFDKTKQLEELARNYEADLETNRQNLASVGKTSSSVRSRSEQLLQEQNAGLVESVGKKFSFQTGGLERQQASAERDLPLELERLRDKSTQARIEALRRAEAEVGSEALSGYADLFGGIGGDLPRKQVTDALSFSSNWLF